jgi:acyl-CoA synthetase (AMP-forming)/AMP-acid ligase II
LHIYSFSFEFFKFLHLFTFFLDIAAVFKQLEERFKAPVIEAYAMTENSHQMTSNQLPPGKRKPGSVGVGTGT